MTWGSGRLGRFAKQRRPYRPHVRNLPQLAADGMLATFHQQIVPG